MIITIRDVERAVMARFQFSRDQFLARNSARKVARPRQIAMYLARELTGASFPRLGQHFGRDHSTVLHGCRTIAALAATNAKVARQIDDCREILKASQPWKENVAQAVAERGLEAGA